MIEEEIVFQPLSGRPQFYKGTVPYKNQMEKVHNAGNASNKRTYCLTHHSMETRTTANYPIHAKCHKKTPVSYSGKTLEETEKKMMKLAKENALGTDDYLVAIFFTEDTAKKEEFKVSVNQSSQSENRMGQFGGQSFTGNKNQQLMGSQFDSFQNQHEGFNRPISNQTQSQAYNQYSLNQFQASDAQQGMARSNFSQVLTQGSEKKTLQNQKDLEPALKALEEELFKVKQKMSDIENQINAVVIKIEPLIKKTGKGKGKGKAKKKEESESEETSSSEEEVIMSSVTTKRRGKSKVPRK